MLRQRVLTAIVLLLIVAGAVTASTPWPMLSLLALMTGCALWEWLRLVINGTALRWGAALAAVLVLMPLSRWLVDGHPGLDRVFGLYLLPLAVLFWLTVAPVAVVRARVPDVLRPGLLALAGVLALAATWYALA